MSLYDDSGTGTRVFVWDQLVFLQPQILLLIVKFPPPPLSLAAKFGVFSQLVASHKSCAAVCLGCSYCVRREFAAGLEDRLLWDDGGMRKQHISNIGKSPEV